MNLTVELFSIRLILSRALDGLIHFQIHCLRKWRWNNNSRWLLVGKALISRFRNLVKAWKTQRMKITINYSMNSMSLSSLVNRSFADKFSNIESSRLRRTASQSTTLTANPKRIQRNNVSTKSKTPTT